MKPHEHVMLEISHERERQIELEGWSRDHDDREHSHGEIAMAAACYAAPKELYSYQKICNGDKGHRFYLETPFNLGEHALSKHDHRRRLVIAAALIVAEIERIDREQS